MGVEKLIKKSHTKGNVNVPEGYDPNMDEMAGWNGGKNIEILNNPKVRMGELISGGSCASARGLAKVAAIMANKGTLNGQSLMSEATWQEMHSEAKPE